MSIQRKQTKAQEPDPVDTPKDEELEKFDATIMIHMIGGGVQSIPFKQIDERYLQGIVQTIRSSLNTLRESKDLTLATNAGTIYILNVDNVPCVEIRRS